VSTGGALRDLALAVVESADERGVAPIVHAGHPVLRSGAVPFDAQLDDAELGALLRVMRATMHAAPGVGLAAPQIGVPLALAVVEDPGMGATEAAVVRERDALPFRVLVNPRYEGVGDERAAFYEGCLSVPGYHAVVARHRRVRLVAADETGAPVDEVLTGWAARIVQHETDHLGGTLYLDRAELRSLAATDAVGARWAMDPTPTAAAEHLGFTLG
jgi:peptide deformylase